MLKLRSSLCNKAQNSKICSLFSSLPCSSLYSVSEALEEKCYKQIKIKGWIKRVRDQKGVTFMVLNDGSPSDLQIVIPKEKTLLRKIKAGSAVEVSGTLVPSGGRRQKYDFVPDDISVVGGVHSDNQLPASPYSRTFVMDPHVARRNLDHRLKLESFAALLRLRAAAKEALHNFFKEREFLHVDTPILTTADCEGSGESFYVQPSNKSVYDHRISTCNSGDQDEQDSSLENNDPVVSEQHPKEFFGRPVFLTVSSQMHLEACACAFKQVYCFNPAFRAESSLTRQHLAEFYMLEAELAFIDQQEPLMELVEKLYLYVARRLLSTCASDIERCLHQSAKSQLNCIERLLTSSAFPRISYTEAVDILQRATCSFRRTLKHGEDIDKEHEKYLVKHVGDVPLFVTHYPAAHKPFYMKRTNDEKYAICFDLLAPHSLEVCGGSLRENDYSTLNSTLEKLNLSDRLKWYADLRQIGYPGTGGFGLGFERYLQSILGLKNVKDTLPFPRWYKHCHL